MKRFAIAFALVVTSAFASASSLMQMMKAEDLKRVCDPSTDERVNAQLRADFQEILTAMSLTTEQVDMKVTGCSGHASAAVTMNLVVVSPALLELPREERLFLLAHEVGHVVNGDFHEWHALGDQLDAASDVAATADRLMPELSQKLERGADQFAAKTLRVMNVNPVTAARSFFRRFGLLALPGTRSHPAARERVALMAQG